jgi:EF hand
MRSIQRWLASGIITALAVVMAAVAQTPDQKKLSPEEPSRLRVDEIVERIMGFDKNRDGKVTKDELPERMHGLIARGDTNKDGALDRDEIKKLASTRIGLDLARIENNSPGAPSEERGPGIVGIERVVVDLKLSSKKKDQALAVVVAHQKNVRKLMDQARAELLQKMKEIMSEEEFKDFKAALDRLGGTTTLNVVPDGR